MITAPYERICITVRHACGHDAINFVFRTPETEGDPRTQGSFEKCKLCQQSEAQSDRQQEAHDPGKRYYLIDGQRWRVYQSEGYWHARRYENRQQITKYFGKVDPRPELEEAL